MYPDFRAGIGKQPAGSGKRRDVPRFQSTGNTAGNAGGPPAGTPFQVSGVKTQRLVDDLVDFVKVDTTARRDTPVFPSSPGQKALADKLGVMLTAMGLQNVKIDQHALVTATLPGNLGVAGPVLGLLAHMDTSPDAPGDNIQPQMHANYQGGDIVLGHGTVIPAADLQRHLGKDIITTDGRTLLGGDDKAGIAEILELLRILKENPALKHPDLRIAFTPDEETMEYIPHFDTNAFGADIAYTIDGNEPPDIGTSTFNAWMTEVTIEGFAIHPGAAYGKMQNAAKIATEFVGKLPRREVPEKTRGEQGFFHMLSLQGNVQTATIKMLLRDFETIGMDRRRQKVQDIKTELERRYPGAKIALKMVEQYRNPRDILKQNPLAVERAREGMLRSGIQPVESVLRGGTDGSVLTHKGLPTPNLGGGSVNKHSVREFVPVQDMVQSVANLVNICAVWSEHILAKAAKPTPPIQSR